MQDVQKTISITVRDAFIQIPSLRPESQSPYHTAAIVTYEMRRLRCKRVPHPTYCPDLTICDFYLFGRLKHQLHDVTVDTAGELINEVTKVLMMLSIGELNEFWGS
jgi:hypothetical protein